MKTTQEQKVFQFSSLFVASSLIGSATIATLIEDFDMKGVLLIFTSLMFLGFIYWFNGKTKNLNGFLSSYATTYISYTVLILLHSLIYLFYINDLTLKSYFGEVALGLYFGYIFNLGISLIVYILFKAILFFKPN